MVCQHIISYPTVIAREQADPSLLLIAKGEENFNFSEPTSSCISDATRKDADVPSCNSIKAGLAANWSCGINFCLGPVLIGSDEFCSVSG